MVYGYVIWFISNLNFARLSPGLLLARLNFGYQIWL